MAKRNLCYKHNCEEFDKLPDILRPVAAEWRTVSEEECELCQKEKLADLQAALGRCVKLLRKWEAHLEINDPTLERDGVIEVIKQARAALAATEAGE